MSISLKYKLQIMNSALQFKLRINELLHAQIVEKAKQNKRSLNAEIMNRLEISLLKETPTTTPYSARDARKRSESTVAISKADLINQVMIAINHATDTTATRCKIHIPSASYDYLGNIQTNEESKDNIINPVIDMFTDLGYYVKFNEVLSELDIAWG